MSKYASIVDTIGHTPVVRINRLAPDGVNLYTKLEAFNPMGSVKDRMALSVIEQAEKSGTLKPGQTVIEATSGNTGIGLAMVCAQKGYPLVVTMAENFSVERRRMMRFLGVKVVLTPASEKGSGMLAKAVELAEKHGWFLCRQFENEANADAHTRTTAPEILEDFKEEGLDYWVTGFGTGGTLKGVARVLKKESPATKIIVCEPDNSQILGSGIPQERDEDGSPSRSHPNFRTHVVQGWSPDFIPKLVEDAAAMEVIDQILPVSGDDAMRYARELAQKEGIFTGISGGATLAGAMKIADSAPAGASILCMLPDTGERYMTTPLFEDIATEMTPEEIEISKSTPGYRFDVVQCAVPAAPTESQEFSEEAAAFVEKTINDPDNPVAFFAFEWCEFCWSVRKFFSKTSIPYQSVDLDSVAYQKDDWGGNIRRAVGARAGTPTIPQIFVAGEHIGGCTEIFDAYKEGRLQKLLDDNQVAFNNDVSVDPYQLLPSWLHSR